MEEGGPPTKIFRDGEADVKMLETLGPPHAGNLSLFQKFKSLKSLIY
jgi:hypothetical protein